MAAGRGSSIWGPEAVPTAHGPAHPVQLTEADYRRMALALRTYQRFKLWSFREELRGITMKLDHATRTATVSNLAWLTTAQAARERR
jgi:hypothetical protein